MGLFDNPLGFLFGDEPEQGAIDRRMNREPEGQRWWERWEQTFGQGGPMDPMNVYPRALTALETLMGHYFPGWGNLNFGWQAPLAPAPGNTPGVRTGRSDQFVGRPAQAGGGRSMPGILDMAQDGGGVWGAAGTLMDSPTLQSRDAPVHGFKPDDFSANPAPAIRRDMSYRIKQPGEPGYDPKRDYVPDALQDGGFKTAPVGDGYAMTPAPAGGGAMNPGLLEPLTLSIDGHSYPVVTKWDRARNDLAMQYVAALTGMMNPWLQGGMELERGRYGAPYQTPGSSGLLGGAVNSFAGGFGKGFGDYAGGKVFG